MTQPVKIISVVGARPNFMKIAPFIHAVKAHNQAVGTSATARQIKHLLVHTGQHYDKRMSQAFFDSLNIPRPDLDLEIGSGSHANQVGNTMIAFEKVIREHQPDWVIVVGDVNATCACSITAKKEHVKLAHIEAGLRSFDLDMPEEINRMVTDRLADLLFTTDAIASENLRKEGVPDAKIKEVGNIMIDTLEAHREAAAEMDVEDIIHRNAIVPDSCDNSPSAKTPQAEMPALQSYALMTMHRPSNVDQQNILEPLMRFLLDTVCADMPLVWPIHPRTNKQLKSFGLWDEVSTHGNMILLHPVGYHEMLRLNMGASLMLTDSGGLQEECCVLGTPCMTLRWNTERPITLRDHGGASVLVGNAVEKLRETYHDLRHHPRKPRRPPLWDGATAGRIVTELASPRPKRIDRGC